MTRSTATGSARFRQRKLSTRQALQILREDQVDQVDDEAQRNVPKVDTGVEKGEEIEHHLQAAISASHAAAIGGKVAQIYIPTPDAIHSSIQYDRLHNLTFSQPATYIRFSSTVEDCCGCPYDLDDEDDAYLKSMNRKRNASTQCSEDQFEEVMDLLEKTAQAKQPYAAVDNPPVLGLEDMEPAFDDEVTDSTRPFVKDIYEHWKTRRLGTNNRALVPSLKVGVMTLPSSKSSSLIVQLETGAETDDSDPYVCFRRREVRAIRKTRGRDAHSAEKLKKMRKELEEARKLLESIRQREILKREQLAVDRQLFEQRSNLRQVKLNLPEQYKDGDEDLLINQKVLLNLPHRILKDADSEKPPKRKALDITTQRAAANQLRQQQKSDGRSVESDLLTLQEYLEHKEAQIQEAIDVRIAQHKRWNEGWVDLTRAPLTPASEINSGSSFRTATTEYLPTPPSSTSEHVGDAPTNVDPAKRQKVDPVPVRYASPSYDGPWQSQTSFRRRIGRGGRLMIDRRGMRLQSNQELDQMDDIVVDRFKYDRDDDDDDEVPTYLIDPNDISSMRYRSKITQQIQAMRHAEQARQLAAAAQATAAQTSTQARLPGPDG